MTDKNTTTTDVVQPAVKAANDVVKLTKASLLADKESGLTNPEMAKKYGLAPAQITKALKMVGLQKTKAKAKAKFVIVSDENTELTA